MRAEEPHHAEYLQRQLMQRRQAWRRRRTFAAAFVHRNASTVAGTAAAAAVAALHLHLALDMHMDAQQETDMACTLTLADEAPPDLTKAVIRWL